MSVDGLGKKLFYFLIVVGLVNIAVFDVLFFLQTKNAPETSNVKAAQTSKETTKSKSACPQSCITKINEVSSALSQQSVSEKTITTTVPSEPKEYYAPIGAGNTSADDWEDVAGLQVTIDTTKYSKIKAAYFEASVRIPTKNQWANVRLYDIDSKHPVWFSEVSFPSGNDPTLLISNPIVLETGYKRYQVQMKTQLKYPAYLDQSRVRIVTE